MTRTLFALALGLAACAAPSGDPQSEPEAPEQVERLSCGADDYQEWVGQRLEDLVLPPELKPRILGPNSIATMDYLPTRMNIYHDENNIIIRVQCG
ncbi:MAG: hypothetical protein HRU11_02635 [Parvularculaceae bacterium]|nr:hypothetical protein [Parvularculaceae bacterium]